MNSAARPPPVLCPRCERLVAKLFDGADVCARCASVRVLSLAVAEEPTETVDANLPSSSGSAHPEAIGPYTILDELGRGGMGVVYLAQHAKLGRVVALKTVRAVGAAGADFELRFLREAQTVGGLRHPHIVGVHDAGRDRGHAWFAMDYIAGGDLARRLRERRQLEPRAAAQLMQKVAAAVAHSHAQGVLHRDMKPSNILLDGDEPRVADFGLAAQLEPGGDLTAATAVLGTPHYLSPEALRGRRADRGVASDIYALGVILYEMLAGRTPFAGAAPAELPALVAAGQIPPLNLLAPQTPRDLVTICHVCLDPDPARRYAGAAALADDLERFLAGDPIAARPLPLLVRWWRRARRRPAVAAVWAMAAMLIVGAGVAAVALERERRQAAAEAATSRALADFLQNDLLAQAAPENQPDRDIKLRTVLDRAAEKIPGRFAQSPQVEAEVRLTLGATYHSLGEYAAAERQLRRAVVLRRSLLGAEHVDTLRAELRLAVCLDALGRFDEAGRLIRAAMPLLIRAEGPDHPDVFDARSAEASLEQNLGHFAVAENLAQRELEQARRVLGPEHEKTRVAMNNLASILWSEEKLSAAETLNREALEIYERALGPDHPETMAVRNNLATVLTSQGRPKDAEAIHRRLLETRRRLLGPEHPETLRSLGNLATAVSEQGRFAEADALYAELLAARRRVLAPDHPDVLRTLHNQAYARGRSGKLDEAIALEREAADGAARTLGPENRSALDYRRNQVGMLVTAKRVEEALPLAHELYAASLRAFGPADVTTINTAEALAGALGLAGRHAEAEPIWRQIVAVRAAAEPDHWRTHFLRGQHGKSLALSGRPEEAEPLLRGSYEFLTAHLAAMPAGRRSALHDFAAQLANVYTALGRPTDAAEWQAKARP